MENLRSLDTKRYSSSSRKLTFTELESAACLWTTRLLTFNLTAITCNETLSTQSALVFLINLHQSTGNSQTGSLRLTGETATEDIKFNVILTFNIQSLQGLLNHILKNRRREIICKVSLVDCNFTGTFGNIDTCNSTLTSA